MEIHPYQEPTHQIVSNMLQRTIFLHQIIIWSLIVYSCTFLNYLFKFRYLFMYHQSAIDFLENTPVKEKHLINLIKRNCFLNNHYISLIHSLFLPNDLLLLSFFNLLNLLFIFFEIVQRITFLLM